VTSASRLLIVLASVIAALESMSLLILAGVEVSTIHTDRVSVAVTTALFFCLYAGGLLTASVALWRLKGWSRGPIVLAQLIQLGVAWSFAGGATTWVAIVLAVPACVCLGLTLSPATTRALYPELAQ
jgi:hypothetical protein